MASLNHWYHSKIRSQTQKKHAAFHRFFPKQKPLKPPILPAISKSIHHSQSIYVSRAKKSVPNSELIPLSVMHVNGIESIKHFAWNERCTARNTNQGPLPQLAEQFELKSPLMTRVSISVDHQQLLIWRGDGSRVLFPWLRKIRVAGNGITRRSEVYDVIQHRGISNDMWLICSLTGILEWLIAFLDSWYTGGGDKNVLGGHTFAFLTFQLLWSFVLRTSFAQWFAGASLRLTFLFVHPTRGRTARLQVN